MQKSSTYYKFTYSFLYSIFIISTTCSTIHKNLGIKPKDIQFNIETNYKKEGKKRKISNSSSSVNDFHENKKYYSNMPYALDLYSGLIKAVPKVHEGTNYKTDKVFKLLRDCENLRNRCLDAKKTIDYIKDVCKRLKSDMSIDDARNKRDDSKFKAYVIRIHKRKKRIMNTKQIKSKFQ